MKKFASAVFFALLLAESVFSQDAKPVPKPSPPGDSDVVKISTSLIQLDVTVTDSKGKAIADLRPDEIEIYENGEKQKVTGLTFVSASKNAAEKSVAVDKEGVPAPAPALTPGQVRRTIALIVDDLSLSFESVFQTRRTLKKFVDEQMQEGDLVAIIRTGAGIGALQQFTADKKMLHAAIEKVKWNPMGSGGLSAFAPIEITEDVAAGTPAQAGDVPSVDAARGLDEFRETVFATGTLGALRYVITGMSELPGRKSVILFSHGFRLLATDSNSFQTSSDVLGFVRALVDSAMRSSVVFYAVDPRGLQYTGLTASDTVTSLADPSRLNEALSGRARTLSETQDGLRYLTRETGGFAVLNNNDLSGGVSRVLDDQSYYLIAYEPDSDTFDAARRRFNNLDIKVLRPGATARFRSGFFNVVSDKKQSFATKLTPVQQMHSALVSPFAVSGVSLRLNGLFGSDAKGAAYVRSLLHVDAGDLEFIDDKDGQKKAVFDVLAVSFGDNGQIIDQIGKTYVIRVKPSAYHDLVNKGFVYHFVFPVRKPGAYQYRVALRDTRSGRTGSASQFIQIPDLKKNRLTLSSIVLESLTADEWQRASRSDSGPIDSDPLADSATRRITRGTVLRYGLEIYNAKLDDAKLPRLTTRIRVFREGEMILDGRTNPFELRGQTDHERLKTTGAIAIGSEMRPGDYILQVVVTDEFGKAKQRIATQYVQFEVVQ